uniref:Uncharacterized protein n=1 Tax=Capra hircus TaxID=9925 RepID=A0A8C2SAR7_CAPHI
MFDCWRLTLCRKTGSDDASSEKGSQEAEEEDSDTRVDVPDGIRLVPDPPDGTPTPRGHPAPAPAPRGPWTPLALGATLTQRSPLGSSSHLGLQAPGPRCLPGVSV